MHRNQDRIKKLAKTIWKYLKLNDKLEKSDCILVLGSHDTRVAERGAQLYLEGFSDLLVFSGGLGKLTKHIWKQTEAEKFAEIATKMGVREKDILIENKSTNTGENIQFSYQLLKEKKITPKKMILVHKPYMERRTFATFKKQWPDKNTEILVTSPNIPFEKYPTEEKNFNDMINIMVGDLQRIKEYPKMGFQVEQQIPDEVWQAYLELVKFGFTDQIMKD
jgi:uncharacterized SAM-binding protein YcdF (DUF218 family)